MSQEHAKSTQDSPRQSGTAGRAMPGELEAPTIGDWLHIEADGTVVVYTGKAEVGQNIRTSLAQAVAEELRMPVDAIQLVMADTDHTPYDAGTFGSRTTPTMAVHLHKVAAATRELLVDVAAERWGVGRAELRVDDGTITHPSSGRRIGFGELIQGEKLTQEYGDDAPITPAEQWTVADTPAAKVDGRSIVTGARRYTPDLTRPEMLFGMVLRPPAFGATLTSLDTGGATALPGVTVVHEGEFVGVAAPNREVARQALGAIRAEWSTPEQISSAELFEYLRNHPAPPPPEDQRWGGSQSIETGSLEAGGTQGGKKVERKNTGASISPPPPAP